MTRTALVLGAGGLVGEAFEAGVLHALHDVRGFDARDADVIVGTSAGSLTGASLRFGISAPDLASYLTDEPLSPEGRAIFDRIGPIPDPPVLSRPRFRVPSRRLMFGAMRHPWRSRAGLLCAAVPTGTIDMTPFGEVFRNLTGPAWCERDLWITATRLPLGERVIFGRDESWCDVPLAVCASCAIPGVFKPVKIDGQRYVDGGVHSPTNADVLIGEGYDEVIIVSPMSAHRVTRRTNPMRTFFRAMLGREVRALRRDGARVTTYQPGAIEQRLMGMNALDDTRCPDVVRAAYAATVARLERSTGTGQLAA
jgi:NTE family protein